MKTVADGAVGNEAAAFVMILSQCSTWSLLAQSGTSI
jgi:pyridoxal/pyridoxine/pyridoxamine kinase